MPYKDRATSRRYSFSIFCISDNLPELIRRVPGINIDGILNLRAIPQDGNLSFIEFWDAMNSALQIQTINTGT